jgi:membrane-associated protein
MDILLPTTAPYGPFAFGVILFLSSLGFPFPSAVLLLTTGALAQHGLVDWRLVLVLGLAGTVLGDCASYALGRSVGGWVLGRSRRWAQAWGRAEAFLGRYGGAAVYLTRFLLPALDVPTNLLAGSGGLAFRRFLLWSVAGRATWLALYGSVGYISGSQWHVVAQAVSTYSGWLAGLAAAGLGIYILLRKRVSGQPFYRFLARFLRPNTRVTGTTNRIPVFSSDRSPTTSCVTAIARSRISSSSTTLNRVR